MVKFELVIEYYFVNLLRSVLRKMEKVFDTMQGYMIKYNEKTD